MMNSALTSNFVFEIVDKNRKDFKSMSEIEVRKHLENKKFYYDGFKQYVSGMNIFLPLDSNKIAIEKYLKAEFIRQLFSEEDYYRVLLEDDLMINKILNP